MQDPSRGWKLFYGDGRTFSSNDGTWDEAPDQNVQLVMVYEMKTSAMGRPTRRIYSGCDYYFKDGDEFGQSFDDIKNTRGVVKNGKWMPTEAEFDAIMNIAMKDYNI